MDFYRNGAKTFMVYDFVMLINKYTPFNNQRSKYELLFDLSLS